MRYVQVRHALTRVISIAILAPLGVVAQENPPAPAPALDEVVATGSRIRLGPYTTYNTSAGYEFNANVRANLYVRNILDDVSERDPWKIDFAFTNMEVADFVGREISLEAVFKF